MESQNLKAANFHPANPRQAKFIIWPEEVRDLIDLRAVSINGFQNFCSRLSERSMLFPKNSAAVNFAYSECIRAICMVLSRHALKEKPGKFDLGAIAGELPGAIEAALMQHDFGSKFMP